MASKDAADNALDRVVPSPMFTLSMAAYLSVTIAPTYLRIRNLGARELRAIWIGTWPVSACVPACWLWFQAGALAAASYESDPAEPGGWWSVIRV